MKGELPALNEKAVLPFGPVNGVCLVTGHCINRFVQRAGVRGTMGEVMRHLEQWMTRAKPAELKPGRELKKILAHGKTASYHLLGNAGKGAGWILVVEGRTLRTVHPNDTGDWRLPEGA